MISNSADAAATTFESATDRPVVKVAGQNWISGFLALAIIAAWAAGHIFSVFFFEPAQSAITLALTPVIIAVMCWLNVGLFILAHDAMHGTLLVGARGAGAAIGQLCLFLYAGFSYPSLNTKHHDHHRFPGTARDPDYGEHTDGAFWPWYLGFFREYFSWREALILATIFWVYVGILGAPIANMLLFWAAPSILSSAQLFYFGTYLPHRPDHDPFTDHHNARSNAYSWIASLVTCFHFGYHLEHHRYPYLPWWRLPEGRVWIDQG